MADAPWRCSQCGTVNEPVANACRTCGRWPSLFELEGSTIEFDEPAAEVAEGFEAHTVEVEEVTPPDVLDAEVDDVQLPPEFEPADEEGEAAQRPRWQRFARLVVPIGIALYVLVTALVRDG